LIDIGVNLTNSRFDKDRDFVIERAIAQGIKGFLVTGTNIKVSQQASEISQRFPDYLCCTAGVHPHDADGVSEDYLEQLKKLVGNRWVKAIGECGLDFNRNFSAPKQQLKIFSEQVQLAQQVELPLFLHQRDAFDPWYDILSPYFNSIPAMVSHCFTSDLTQLRKCLDAGMYIGVTGWLCDERRGQTLRDVVQYIPLDRLMIETDAPYLLPRTIKPKPKSSRNEPSYLPYIVQSLAELTQHSVKEIIKQTEENSRKVFNWGLN
jgi:TatD DNase family protein